MIFRQSISFETATHISGFFVLMLVSLFCAYVMDSGTMASGVALLMAIQGFFFTLTHVRKDWEVFQEKRKELPDLKKYQNL